MPPIERRPADDASDANDAIHLQVARIVGDDVPERVRQAVDAVVAAYRQRKMKFAELLEVVIDVTRGRYFKTTQQFDHHLRLSARTRVHLSFNAQQATRNLDGSEKMSLGGPYAVRAYDMFSADSGYIASATVHAGVPAVPGLGVSIFAIMCTLLSRNSRGASIEYAIGKHVTVSLSYAMRTTGEPGR
ncbi:hypothetical protein WJ36_09350 [Burkholderia ubonensis]|uniref:ShlB/FhaC/HecB family hemolysin secretion/activation protein n=1 Tax=Burkholderia ubonensis TaxID=101571 RepID=UPI00075B015F|nr:ShlB/FhaC/HecB family hemolysin secretion/activation protein [Burkholderia ubonensis]KVG83541.1 hypothetical protein WJ36_09350 [Burkholderia ubonensis]